MRYAEMKAILISIHPQWVELILNFIKKDEIRKGTAIGKAINRLIKEQGVAPMLIYCTKDTKNIYRIMRNYNNKVLKLVASSKTIQEELKDENTINGKVVAQFDATAEEIVTVNRLDNGKVVLYRGHKNGITNRKLMEGSCLTFDEMNNYLQGKIGTDIHINNLVIFDKLKEIGEFKHYKRFDCYNADFDYTTIEYRQIRLTKAPQSWCYIEVN